MKKTTRRLMGTASGVALAALAAGTGIASAQGEATEPAATQAAAADHAHGSSTAPGTASQAAAVPAPGSFADVCEDSELPAHTGFQVGPACVSTPFGEVGAAEDNPQLLITDAPEEVAVGEAFTIEVSTRNLVRDRFLPAAEGGYYVEPSTLDEDGIVRGHFHTACRVLDGSGLAPEPERQAVFVATEDGAGGATPDTVTVSIPGLSAAGEAQCATWAGDGSHRMPMMVFANQIPAFDAVRISVRGAGEADAPADADQAAEAGQAADDGAAAEDGAAADGGAAAEDGEVADAGEAADTGRSLPADETAVADEQGDAAAGAATDEDADQQDDVTPAEDADEESDGDS